MKRDARVLSAALVALGLLAAAPARGAELRFCGSLGNSDDARPLFAGKAAAGIGPVLDDEGALWERGGSTRLNRYAQDGRLLAGFEIPEGDGRGSDQMTRAGDLLVLKLKKALYTFPLNAAPGTKPTRLRGEADVLSANAWNQGVLVAETNTVSSLDPVTGARAVMFQAIERLSALCGGSDGTVYGFGGGKVYAWRAGKPVDGFPKGFQGERPQPFGRHWYSHSWHGTINRFNEAFEPEPGVVLGGASGTFIGYLPMSNDIENGRGMARLRDGLFAVSGMGGVVQFVRWNAEENRFDIVRRIGAFTGLRGLALDADGNLWTSRGSWRWNDEPQTPLTPGDLEASVCAQPVVLGGKTLCVLKKHYSQSQLARGPIVDAAGLSHLEAAPLQDFAVPEDVSGAAVVDRRLIVTRPDGSAFEMPVTEGGQPAGKPVATTLPGLVRCTSLAWFEGRLLAADTDAVVVFERGWKETKRLARHGGAVHIHSDGRRLAVSDPAHGAVHVYDSLEAAPVSFGGLDGPAQIAVSGARVVVYEAGKQRLVKLELSDAPPAVSPAAKDVPPGRPAEDGYVDIGRPGGLPIEVAVTENAVSVRTTAARVRLGVANDVVALATTGTAIALPGADGSRLRLAVALEQDGQRERFGFADHKPIHAPFNEDPAVWTVFDLDAYREILAARRQEIRIGFDQPAEGKATVVIENAKGERVRNLVSGRSFSAGRPSIVWDGLDEAGRLVAPGRYRWRGVTHEGIRPRYVMNFANGDEPTTESWGPNHSTLQQAASNGERVFFAAPVTEGGWALVALDDRGRFVQGYEQQHGLGIQRNAIAADAAYLYCAQDGFAWGGAPDPGKADWKATWKLTLVRYDIRSGNLVEWPDRQRAVEVDRMDVGPASDLDAFNLGGLAVLDGRLYVGSRDKKAVFVLDAASGKPVGRIALEGVRHLAAGKELLAATDRGVIRPRDGRLLFENRNIGGLAVAPNGDLLVSDVKTHQVRRFPPEGRELAAIGVPGGPYRGAYDPQRMVNPRGLVFGPDGRLWVTEDRWNPKRVLAWDLAKNRVAIEKFGMPHYGGDGSGFDPENPRRWIGLGCFWDVDLEKKTARPTHVLGFGEGHLGHYEPQGYAFFREAGRTFVCTRGKIALLAEVMPDGTLRDLAATAGTHHFAYAFNWKPPQAYIDAFYAKWPEKRKDEKPGRKGEGRPWSQRGMGVLWVDRNGDGAAQQEEFDFCGDRIDYGGGAWGHLQNSLTFHMPVADPAQVRVAALRPKGMLPNGVPDYPALDEALAQAVPVDLTPGYKRSGVATVRDRFGRFLFNSDPEMNAYAADGHHLWSFPNRWSDVHGSHDAPLPEPGVMQGTMAFLGVAPFDDAADVVFLNGNHGRCFVLTSDGLYLDEAFVDVRVSYLRNEYRLGGEIFGGSFARDARSGRYFVQIGHGPYRIYELAGFDTVRRISGTISVTAEQIAAAERQGLRRAAARHQAKEAAIPGKLGWDKDGRFRTQVELAADATHLHLTWRVQDASPWVNRGRDWTKLFATGDTVDFQFGADPKADPKRREPVGGDRRLLIAPHDGKAVAVLYDYRKPGGGGSPVEFTSPWRGAKVDDVRRIAEAKIEVKTEADGYIVTASLPLAELGLTLGPGAKLRADFGVTFGDASGADTNLRSYWSNQSTGLVDDIPGEAMLSPNLWGDLTVAP